MRERRASQSGTLLVEATTARTQGELVTVPLQALQRELHLLKNAHSERGIDRRLRSQFCAETLDAAPIFINETIGLFEQTHRHE